jgi:membrane protease YdiL (CAAX protease family)
VRLWRFLRAITIDQLRAIDREVAEERAPNEGGALSWQVAVILLVAAVSLTLQYYFGDDALRHAERGDGDRWWELKGWGWWTAWRVIGFVILPAITIACMPGQRLRDYHVSPRGFVRHLWIYAVMFALILPVVIYASTTDRFRETYPFYRLANRSYTDLALWEAMYAVQFMSLEFFFRGFLLKGLRRTFGANAIFVAVVPYCMIHYQKPFPETLGAIGAGVVLGTLAMRTRSIWGGVAIHIGVATTMDVLALRGCPPIGSGLWCGMR